MFNLIGRCAHRWPETTVYACSLLGMTVGLFGWAGLFALLGLPFGSAQLGFQIGLAIYAVFFVLNLDDLKADADARIAFIKLNR